MINKFHLIIIFIVLLFSSSCETMNHEKDRTLSVKDNKKNSLHEEEIEIHLWDYFRTDPESSAVEWLITKYMEAHPNVKIKRTSIPLADMTEKLLIASATGKLPDLIITLGENHSMFAATGMFHDISEEVKVWGEEEQYFPIAWASNEYEGNIYGIPMGSSNMALYYNSDLLDKAELDPPKNWNDLIRTAGKLKELDVYGFQATAVRNEQAVYSFLPFVFQSGSDLNTFNSAGTIEAVTLWKEMIDNGSMSKETLQQGFVPTTEEFLSGNVAMIVNGPWIINVLEKKAAFKWGVVPLPANKEKATVQANENWAITSTSKHKDIAWDFIKFSQKEEILEEFLLQIGRIPSRKSMINDEIWQKDKRLKVFIENMEVAKSNLYGPNYPKIAAIIQNMLQDVLRGYKSPEVAVKEAEEEIKPLLPKYEGG